jgi:hypothetical protein
MQLDLLQGRASTPKLRAARVSKSMETPVLDARRPHRRGQDPVIEVAVSMPLARSGREDRIRIRRVIAALAKLPKPLPDRFRDERD